MKHTRNLAILACLVSSGVSLLPLGTPEPVGVDAPPAEFSAERAHRHVVAISSVPRPIGSPANAAARAYLLGELEAMGLEPQRQSTAIPDWYGEAGAVVVAVNVMARIPGRDSTGAIALVGHYDTVPASPGANDDASAVAAILEAGRALLAGPRPQNDVILLFTDAEEPAPRYGSTAFVESHPWAKDVALVVNLEAIGSGGPSLLLETTGSPRVVEEYLRASPRPAAFSFLTWLVDTIGGSNTDFAPFKARGVPGLSFAWLRGSPIYHTERDTADRVDLGSLAHHGAHALGTARRFGDLDLGALRGRDDTVYFTLFRSLGVRYPPLVSILATVLAVLAFGAAVVLRIRRGESTLRSLLAGAGAGFAAVFVGAIAATIAWVLWTKARPSLGVWESYLVLAGLIALGAAVGIGAGRLVTRKAERVDLAGGLTLLWVLLAAGTGITLPAMGYLFVWPALAAAIALALRPLAATVLFSVPAILLLVPAGEVFFQMAQPRPGNTDSEMVAVVVLPVLLALLVLLTIRAMISAAPRPT